MQSAMREIEGVELEAEVRDSRGRRWRRTREKEMLKRVGRRGLGGEQGRWWLEKEERDALDVE
jgi:hypothetical protein